jgi:hypothetical protein
MKRSGSGGNPASAPSPPSVGALARWANRVPFGSGLAVVALLVLIAASPLFEPGLPNVADAPIHVFRTAEWVRNWQAGILIPRWSPYLAYGYGYPLFVFAPPLPYMLAGSLHLLGLSLTTSIKLLSVGCLALGGFGMYALVRAHFDARAGVVASAAYIYAPFLLREAYLYGGNYPQLLAISLFPSVLWAFHKVTETNRTRHLLLAAGLYAALILSHNFHSLVFSPVLLLYILLSANTYRGRAESPSHLEKGAQSAGVEFRDRILRAGLAMAMGLGWTACFWLPALIERRWTRALEDFYVEVSPFHLRFLALRDLFGPPEALDARAANPALPFTLGIVIVALVGAGLVATIFRPKTRWPAWFFGLLLLLVVLMMLPGSEWLWSTIPLLAMAEFPWRLLGIAALSSAVLAGAAVTVWQQPRWAVVLSTLAVIAIVLGSAVYLYPPKPFVPYGPEGTPSLGDQVRFERTSGAIGSTSLGEYLSMWVQEVPRTSPLVPDLLAGRPTEKLDRSSLPPGVEAELLAQSPNSDRYRFTSDQAFSARFSTFYFPGWEATLDGRPVALKITDPHGLIEVPIPAGELELTLRFVETPLRAASAWVSLLSLAGTVVLVMLRLRRGKDREIPPSVARSTLHAQFAILVVLLLILFLAKELLVDPHTTWFRRDSPDYAVSGVMHPARVTLADKVLFLGYDLDRDWVRAGDPVRLTLYWQALQPLEKNLNAFVHLDAPPSGTTFLAADTSPPGDVQAQIDIPTTRWELDSYVRDEHRFEVPADLPPVLYTLRAGLYDPATGEGLGEAIELQEIRVLPGRPTRQSQVPNRVEFRLGEHIELLGYEFEAGPAPALTLYWRTAERIEQDYTVFVHVLDGHGAMLGQGDGLPLGGMYPTQAWWPEQIITDRRELPFLDEDGQVLVGLYDPMSMQRLPAHAPDGGRLPDDAIRLSPSR